MENNEIKGNVSEGRTVLVAEDVESNFLLLKAIIGKMYNLLHAWNLPVAGKFLYRAAAPAGTRAGNRPLRDR